ncbi:YihY/virulence factor BrkB family protein [Ramlibacter agri]|uniref:YihY/virulence factor BrkB family protein n=1 Tax=Ramlibacter agri TaxID=2728837 RepID=UPI001F0F1E09|nr:YihY/virulence factor BrkB family protein [Ramlibacter agri]
MDKPNPRRLAHLFVQAGKSWSDDDAPSMGAAIAYYTVFSMAPLLVIAIAVAGAVFGHDAVTGQIVTQMRGLVGEQGATFVQSMVAASSDTHQGLVAGIISVVVLAIGATSVFTQLQISLDRIWQVPESQKPSGIWNILRSRLLSFGVILALVFLLMVSLALSAALAAVGSWTGQLVPGAEVLGQVLNVCVSLGVTTLLFAVIYKMLPSVRIAWRDVWFGAFATAILFEIGKFLIGLYLGKSSMSQSFAAAGSLVVLIAWVYYAAQIFLLGAEFTKLYAQEHGSLQSAGAGAVNAAPPAKGAEDAAHPVATSPAMARLEETRHRIEVEAPPKIAHMKHVAKLGSAIGGTAVALGVFGLQLYRSKRGGKKRTVARKRRPLAA